eukprot:5241087-Pyramimonas_sp.AAC.1
MSIMRPRSGPGLGGTGWLRLLLAGLVWGTDTPKRFPSGLLVGSRSSQGHQEPLWESWEKPKLELKTGINIWELDKNFLTLTLAAAKTKASSSPQRTRSSLP